MILTVLALVVTSTGQTGEKSISSQLRKSTNVLRFFDNHKWLTAPRKDKCWEVPWQKSCRIARKLVQFHTKKRERLERLLIPRTEAELRAYINDDCLEDIIEWETAGTWSPTIWNGQGSGAYGLPQALPGSKMASAGADWATNPITQIKWMYGYVNSRYGGSCNARAFKIANGWY